MDGLQRNLIREGMSVTEVNRLLYTGSHVVADRLDLIGKKRRRRRRRNSGGNGGWKGVLVSGGRIWERLKRLVGR